MSEAIVNSDVIGENDETENLKAAGEQSQRAQTVIVKKIVKTGGNGQADEEDYTDNTAAKGESMIPKSRLDQVIEQKKRALDALRTVADSMVEDVPSEYQELIPDLEPEAKITWIRNAVRKGLFKTVVINGLDTKRPGGKPPIDFSNMTTEQIIARGYK